MPQAACRTAAGGNRAAGLREGAGGKNTDAAAVFGAGDSEDAVLTARFVRAPANCSAATRSTGGSKVSTNNECRADNTSQRPGRSSSSAIGGAPDVVEADPSCCTGALSKGRSCQIAPHQVGHSDSAGGPWKLREASSGSHAAASSRGKGCPANGSCGRYPNVVVHASSSQGGQYPLGSSARRHQRREDTSARTRSSFSCPPACRNAHSDGRPWFRAALLCDACYYRSNQSTGADTWGSFAAAPEGRCYGAEDRARLHRAYNQSPESQLRCHYPGPCARHDRSGPTAHGDADSGPMQRTPCSHLVVEL